MFGATPTTTVYRGLNLIVGTLGVTMARGRRPRRVLRLQIDVFADRMRARRWEESVHLTRAGFGVRRSHQTFLY
jgi:hypothetical protein